MNKFILIIGLLILNFFAKAQQSIPWYYKDNFNSIYESSNKEMLSINIYYNDRNERKIEFIKIGQLGNIIYRKETTDILPWYSNYRVTPNDEVVIATEIGFKRFNFNGDFLGTVSSEETGPFIIDADGKYIISQSVSPDCNVIKMNNDGTTIWKNLITNAKYITPPLEINGEYLIGVHNLNESFTDQIQFIKYGNNGDVAMAKQYDINDDILELHKTTTGLFAISKKGLMISLNENLDTLWTRKIATGIDEFKGNESGIYFYKFEGTPAGTLTITKVNFNGDKILEYNRYKGANEFIRSVTLTKADILWVVCSTDFNNNSTLLLRFVKGNTVSSVHTKEEILFNIYPNPVAEDEPIHIGSLFSEGTLTIFDQLGNMVYEVGLNPNHKEIKNSLAKGFYFYHFQQNNSILKSGKLVVN